MRVTVATDKSQDTVVGCREKTTTLVYVLTAHPQICTNKVIAEFKFAQVTLTVVKG